MWNCIGQALPTGGVNPTLWHLWCIVLNTAPQVLGTGIEPRGPTELMRDKTVRRREPTGFEPCSPTRSLKPVSCTSVTRSIDRCRLPTTRLWFRFQLRVLTLCLQTTQTTFQLYFHCTGSNATLWFSPGTKMCAGHGEKLHGPWSMVALFFRLHAFHLKYLRQAQR